MDKARTERRFYLLEVVEKSAPGIMRWSLPSLGFAVMENVLKVRGDSRKRSGTLGTGANVWAESSETAWFFWCAAGLLFLVLVR